MSPDEKLDMLLDAVEAAVDEIILQGMHARTRLNFVRVELGRLREPPPPPDEP